MAETVLVNGQIFTQEAAPSPVQALAMRDGRIAAVGTTREVIDRFPHAERVDLQGAVVLPGLVDAHVHFQWFSLTMLEVDVYEVPRKEIALERVAARAAETPAGRWIEGRGWKNELWPDRAFPTAADLDRVAPHHPVLLRDKSGHAGWANSLALKIAGIGDGTPNPEGGEIRRDGRGKATGLLMETAIELVRRQIPPATSDELVQAMRLGQQKCWEVGLTGLHDFDGPACFRGLQTLRRAGELGLRIVKNIPARYLDQAVALGLQSGFGDDWLRIGGVKIFADGALGPQTALMIEPYANDPANRGIAVTDKEEMAAIAGRAAAHGLSVTVHAIGDRAVHDVLDVYEALRRDPAAAAAGPLRHRIEHVQVYHPADRERLAELGVVASMQPIHATSDMEMADRYWGERARYSYALRDMLASGALLALGSDCPVEPIDILPNIYAAVTRKKPGSTYAPDGWYNGQCLTVEEAVRGFTLGPAQTAGLESDQGTIAPGKWADLTILDRDIFTGEPEEILEARVLGAVTGGIFRHRVF